MSLPFWPLLINLGPKSPSMLSKQVHTSPANICRAVMPTHAPLQPLFAASASAGVLWELALLQRHYHPAVAAKAKAVAQRSSAGAFNI